MALVDDYDFDINFVEFLAVFLSIFVLAMVIRLLHKRRFNFVHERKLPNHILYFKNKSIKLVEDQLQEAAGQKSINNQNPIKPTRSFVDKSTFKIKQFLPPEIAPYGNKVISQPGASIDTNTLRIKEKLQTPPTEEAPEEVAAPKPPESSKLFMEIQAAAEKLCDDTKKADKERKENERKQREEEKKKAEEDAKRLAQLEAEAAAAAEKKGGLGKGGLAKGKLGLSKTGGGLGGGKGNMKLSLNKNKDKEGEAPAEEKKEEAKEETKAETKETEGTA